MLHTAWSNVSATTISITGDFETVKKRRMKNRRKMRTAYVKKMRVVLILVKVTYLIASKQLLLIQPLRQQWRTG